jgi:uncharacterized membrane protein
MQDHAHSARPKNVGTAERTASLLGGGWLAWKGLRRGGLTGVVAAIAGVALVRRGSTGHCALKEKLGKGHARAAQPSDYFNHGVHVEESVTIQAPVPQVFAFWRDFQNLARFMENVKSVEVIDQLKSHWVVEGPAGTVEWDAEIINEEPDRLISWCSLPGAEVNNTGTVQFREAPGARGTEVRVTLEYLPPAGKVGLAIAKVLGKTPGSEVREDLRRLRQLLETGEVPTTEGQPRGSGGMKGRIQTAAVAGYARMAGRTDTPSRTSRDRGAMGRAEDTQNSTPQNDASRYEQPDAASQPRTEFEGGRA